MTKAASICSVLLGLGFGVPGLIGLVHFARHHEVWTFLGFPTYGGGPFERIGLPTSVPLLAAFVVVCCGEVTVGLLLWTGAPHGALFSLLLLPIELVFWFGFALPVGPVLGIARTALVLLD